MKSLGHERDGKRSAGSSLRPCCACDTQILLINTVQHWTRIKATWSTNSVSFKVAPRTFTLNRTLIGLVHVSRRATWEYTHLHSGVPADGERQMNINSTFFSHYQGGVIMMNAIPRSSEPSGSKKTQIAVVQAGNSGCKEINWATKKKKKKKNRAGGISAFPSWPQHRQCHWNNIHCSTASCCSFYFKEHSGPQPC